MTERAQAALDTLSRSSVVTKTDPEALALARKRMNACRYAECGRDASASDRNFARTVGYYPIFASLSFVHKSYDPDTGGQPGLKLSPDSPQLQSGARLFCTVQNGQTDQADAGLCDGGAPGPAAAWRRRRRVLNFSQG